MTPEEIKILVIDCIMELTSHHGHFASKIFNEVKRDNLEKIITIDIIDDYEIKIIVGDKWITILNSRRDISLGVKKLLELRNLDFHDEIGERWNKLHVAFSKNE